MRLNDGLVVYDLKYRRIVAALYTFYKMYGNPDHALETVLIKYHVPAWLTLRLFQSILDVLTFLQMPYSVDQNVVYFLIRILWDLIRLLSLRLPVPFSLVDLFPFLLTPSPKFPVFLVTVCKGASLLRFSHVSGLCDLIIAIEIYA